MGWTEDSIPDQSGKIAIVTGANTGIGFETARALAEKGAHVILACRSSEKGGVAAANIKLGNPSGDVEFAQLDLADLDSVKIFSEEFSASHNRLDLLINNAGVMVPPETKTAQGFELQFGVNHIGHFALTAHLLPLMTSTTGSRVVNVASQAHRGGNMNFDDLNFEKRGYSAWLAYGQSKLANLLFTLKLNQLLENSGCMALAAHPGWTGTDLQRTAWFPRLMNPLFAMNPAQGALPTLRAATDTEAKGNDYYGPNGIAEMRGYPIKVDRTQAAKSQEDAETLWQISEQMSGATFAA